jgi:hypothetical protein
VANFLRVKPLGWSLFDILLSALMNQLDIDHTKAINGDDGSSHAPVSQIVLAGAGLEMLGSPLDITTSGANVGMLNINGLAELHVKAGGFAFIDNAGELDVDTGGIVSFSPGSDLVIGGTETIASGGLIQVNNGGDVNFDSGGDLLIKSGALETVASGGKVTAAIGSTVELLGKVRRSLPVDISAANHTLNAAFLAGAQYLRMDLSSVGGSPTIVLTMPDATNPPTLGDYVNVAFTIGVFAGHVEFVRETPSAPGEVIATVSCGRFGAALGTSPYNTNNTTAALGLQWNGTAWKVVEPAGCVFFGADW